MTDMEIIQWLFDCDAITKGFNWPVDVAELLAAKRGLDALIEAKAPAAAVMAEYERFDGAIGPSVMKTLMASDDAFPEVNHSGKPTPPAPGKVTLYVDPAGKRVLADCPKQHGMPAKYSVE